MDFIYKYRKFFIILGIILVAYIIYRYFWEKKDITQDFVNMEQFCESTDEINKKLAELDTYDCGDACQIKCS